MKEQKIHIHKVAQLHDTTYDLIYRIYGKYIDENKMIPVYVKIYIQSVIDNHETAERYKRLDSVKWEYRSEEGGCEMSFNGVQHIDRILILSAQKGKYTYMVDVYKKEL